jgi:agmatine deiminase
MESHDAWMRDVGPTLFTDTKDERRGVGWIFESWGGLKGGLYSPSDHDD